MHMYNVCTLASGRRWTDGGHPSLRRGVNDVAAEAYIIYGFLFIFYFIFPNPLGRLYIHMTRDAPLHIYASRISIVFRETAFWMKRFVVESRGETMRLV